MTDTQKAATRTTRTASQACTDEERAAMRERAHEQKAAAGKAAGESAVRAAICAMAEPERALAERLHALITASAPALAPRTWYGMPAYAKDGTVVCFFQSGGVSPNPRKFRHPLVGQMGCFFRPLDAPSHA